MAEQDYVSAYELKKAFEAVATIAERLPASLNQELKQAAEAGIEDTIARIKRVMDAIHTFEDTLDAKQLDLCNRADQFYSTVKEKYATVRAHMEALGSLPDNLNVPFGVIDVIKLAERCQGMTDTQWARVIDLAKALRA